MSAPSASLPTLSTGLELHQAGQLDQAQAVYRQVVLEQPTNADAWNLLGAVCINLHQFDEAAEHLGEALRLDPGHAAAHDNLGVLLAHHKQYVEAIDHFRQALALGPQQPATLLNLAGALLRVGDVEQAIDAYQRVAAIAPDLLKAHTELAQLFGGQSRHAEAALHWQHVARLTPQDPRAHFELAAALARLGRSSEAKAAYRQTLHLRPDSAETCVNLGVLCLELREHDEAIDLFRRAIQLRPDFAEAHLNLGSALVRQEQWAEAITALEHAIRLKPVLSEAHNNLGIARAGAGNFAEAEQGYQQALELRPDNADALYNSGIALLKQSMVASALERFERAIELSPEYAEAHHNRAAALLLSENFDEGLVEYEWRFRSRDYGRWRPRWPLWQGEPLAGRTIVLVAEQGLGDTIQFIRYAPLVQARGARVVVECPQSLHALLARTPGVDQWIDRGAQVDGVDYCVPLLSLPHRLGTKYETIPAAVPYVFADPERVAAWRARLAKRPGFRVGIVWQGNPQCSGDRWRSVPLTAFEPLVRVPGVQLVSLQKGPGVEQLDALRDRLAIVDYGDALDSEGGAFGDTAAIMKNLDLVVTSDTAAAHLAGALGVPTWTALSFVPDWRWLLDRDDSPWYPTMRLFRQSQWGHWDDVFVKMAERLSALSAAKS